MRRAALLFLASGCRQILGFESPTPVVTADAPVDVDVALDDAPTDVTMDAPTVSVMIAFQQGADGYTGARDTFIDSGTPNAANATSGQLRWRNADRHALIGFEIFSPALIPAGSTITAAQLQIFVTQLNDSGTIHEIAIPWQDTVTSNTFGPAPGVDAGDLGSIVGPSPTAVGPAIIDVTASVAAWSLNPTQNQGWIFSADTGGSDTSARSSEDGVIANRPKLTVTYLQ